MTLPEYSLDGDLRVGLVAFFRGLTAFCLGLSPFIVASQALPKLFSFSILEEKSACSFTKG